MKTRLLPWILFVLILPATILYVADKYSVSSFVFKKAEKRTTIAIQQWITTNAIHVYFVATKDVPMVDIQVVFDAGSSRDGEKFGLAALCASSLNKGTTELTEDKIASTFENLGAIYQSSVDRDKAVFSLRSLSNFTVLDPAVRLFSNVLTKATFPDFNIEILKNQTLISLRRNLQQPSVVAQKAFFETLYANYPYGHMILGALETVSAITKTDLIQFQKQYYVSQNAIISIVGGITTEEAKALATLIAQNIPVGNKAQPLPPVPTLAKGQEKSIPFFSEQTHILLGQPCAIENDPDHFPLMIGNQILGGGTLTSRLFKEIREKKGLAYTTTSNFIEWQKPGPFMISLQTKNEQANEALTLVKKLLNTFIKDGPSEDEISEAKQAIMHSFPLEINTNAKLIHIVSKLGFYQFPLNYLDTYVEQVSKVTRLQVRDAFQRRLDPEKMALIIVGATPPSGS